MKRTNPNEVFPAKYADEEEDRRDEPGQDDHHNHLVGDADVDDDDDDGDDCNDDVKNDLMSCAPGSVSGCQLHRAEPVEKKKL